MRVRSGHNGGPASVWWFSRLRMPTNGRPSQFPAVVLVFLHWKVLVLSFVSDHRISSGADQREASPSRFSWTTAPPPAWTEVLFLGSFLTLAPGFIRNWVGLPGVPYGLARPGRNARATTRLRLTAHALLLCWKLSKRACLAFCISSAAAVSVLLLAWRSRSWIVTSALRCLAKSGNCRRISQGVAYHR
jgi:hypothetical protein